MRSSVRSLNSLAGIAGIVVVVGLRVNAGSGGFDLGQVREQCAFEVSPPDSHN
jgi:hypothetical protein